jgi:hypothetical protein
MINSFKGKVEVRRNTDLCIVKDCYHRRQMGKMFCGIHLHSGEKCMRGLHGTQ